MPGLLETLENQFAGSGLTQLLTQQAGNLGNIQSAVSGLTGGPDLLHTLQDTIHGLPIPPALGSLGNLGGGLSSALSGLPTGDLEGPLAPMLGPLRALGEAAAGVEGLVGVVNVVRGVIELATGKSFTGASGMPLALMLGARGMPGAPANGPAKPLTVDQITTTVAAANRALDGFGPRLDAQKLLDLLRLAGTNWIQMSRSWPTLPLFTDAVEAMETVVGWERRTPAQLTALLAGTMQQAARLIATPRTRVAQPFLDAAHAAAGAADALAAASAALAPVLSSLAGKIADGEQPSPTELAALETQADAIEQLVRAVDLAHSPLADTDDLINSLELTILRVVRTLDPPGGADFIVARVQDAIARIPGPFTDPLAAIVDQVQALDLTFLTDPLAFLRHQVQQAVDEVHAAEDQVRTALTNLLSPVDDALKGVLDAVHLDDILHELQTLPNTIRDFVDNQVKPQIQPIKDAVHAAVAELTSVTADFHPEHMLAQIRQAILDATSFLSGQEVQGAFAQVHSALTAAVEAIEGLNLDGAADEAVTNLGSIEVKLRGIDPSTIPDAAKPLLSQAVKVVTDIDFTAQVASPLLQQVEKALETGPKALLDSLEELLGQLKQALEKFKPSVLVGAALDQPFQQMMDVLRGFHPSDLLQRVADLLAHVADGVHLVDPNVLLGPLQTVYGQIKAGVDTVKPSNLLKPVNDAIAAAIDKVIQATHFDDVFDGLDRALATVNGYVDVLASAGALMNRVATLLDAPGDIDSGLDQLVDATVARLDPVDFPRLQAAFAGTAAAVASIDRDRLAGELAAAMQAAATATPAALAGAGAAGFKQLVRTFPLSDLRAARSTPARARAGTAIERLVAAAAALDGAATPWHGAAQDLLALAPDLQPRLATYARVTQLEGGSVFGEMAVAPADLAALKESVRAALRDGLRVPVTLAFGLFKAIAPHAAEGARGLGALVDALHAKISAITGAAGVSGVVHSVEEIVDLVRHIDLSPVTDPLDVIFGRIEHAVTILDPAPLGAALTAAADAVADLFQLSTLVDPADVQALDAAYDQAVAALADLSPSKVVGVTLDPVFDQALGPVKELLDLPEQLKGQLHEAGEALTASLTADVQRVEVAFDKMLKAVPLDGGGSSVSGSASGSVQLGAA